MAKARVLARIMFTVLAVLLAAYSASLVFPGLWAIEASLVAIVLFSSLANMRAGLSASVITAVIAMIQEPGSLGPLLATVIALLVLETIYEYSMEKTLASRRLCSQGCRYATIAGLATVYGVLLAVSYLAALLLARTYNSLLEMKLPGPLSGFWQLAVKSMAVRIIVYTVMLAVVYWASSRLVAPLLQALAAPSHALRRLLASQQRLEKKSIESMETWYHRLLFRGLGVLVGLFASPVAYPAAKAILGAIRIENPGLGIEAAMTAAVAWLIGIIGYNAGYSAAKALAKGIDWGKVAVAGALALTALVVINAATTPHPLGYLVSELRALLGLLYGTSPSLPDARAITSLYKLLEGIEKYYQGLEDLLRFLIKIFWG